MTRMYIQPSFINSCSDHGEWSGGNDQYRGDKSADIATFDKQGRARVGAFSNEAIEARKPKKKSSVSIQYRILPQAARVNKLTEQLKELVIEYQKGNIDIDEYSLLLSVVSAKRDRAVKLLSKAKSIRAPFEIEGEEAISLGKTHVKGEKNLKTSKGSACSTSAFKASKKPTNSLNLSKVADCINRNDWFYLLSCSTIVLTAMKYLF